MIPVVVLHMYHILAARGTAAVTPWLASRHNHTVCCRCSRQRLRARRRSSFARCWRPCQRATTGRIHDDGTRPVSWTKYYRSSDLEPRQASGRALGSLRFDQAKARRRRLSCSWRPGESRCGSHRGRRPTTASCYAACATGGIPANRAAASGCCCPDRRGSPSARTWCRP